MIEGIGLQSGDCNMVLGRSNTIRRNITVSKVSSIISLCSIFHADIDILTGPTANYGAGSSCTCDIGSPEQLHSINGIVGYGSGLVFGDNDGVKAFFRNTANFWNSSSSRNTGEKRLNKVKPEPTNYKIVDFLLLSPSFDIEGSNAVKRSG